MEKDDEVKGSGNWLQFGDFGYDPRTGRRNNIDPVVKIWESSYATFRNNPIFYSDPSGLDVHEDCETGQIYHVPDGYVGKEEGQNGKDWGYLSSGELLSTVDVTAKAPSSYNVYFPTSDGTSILPKGATNKTDMRNGHEDPYDKYNRLIDKGIDPQNINAYTYYVGPDRGVIEIDQSTNLILASSLLSLTSIAGSTVSLETVVAEEVAVGAEIQAAKTSTNLITQFSTSTIDDAVGLVMNDPNKVAHLFAPKHNLGGLVSKFGGQENTIRAVLNAANGKLPASGVFNNLPVNVGGQTIFLRGNVINGVPRLGTMFIP